MTKQFELFHFKKSHFTPDKNLCLNHAAQSKNVLKDEIQDLDFPVCICTCPVVFRFAPSSQKVVVAKQFESFHFKEFHFTPDKNLCLNHVKHAKMSMELRSATEFALRQSYNLNVIQNRENSSILKRKHSTLSKNLMKS